MKTFFILIFTCVIQHIGLSQFELSGGIFYRNESAFQKEVKSKNRPPITSDPSRYHGFMISLGYAEEKALFGVDFQYHQKSFTTDVVQRYSHAWSHGQISESYRKYLSAHLSYGYFGTRLFLNKVFFKEKKSNLMIGGFIHIDKFLFERETGHSDSTIESHSGVGFNYELQQKIYWTETTYHPTAYQEFNLVTMQRIYPSLGLNVGYRLHLHSILIDFQGKVGFNKIQSRLYIEPFKSGYEMWSHYNEEKTRFFYQFDVRIGYAF